MTTTIDRTKCGDILGATVWAELANEYLEGTSLTGVANAQRLATFLDHQVETVQPYWFKHLGVAWVATINPEPYADLEAMSVDYLEADRHHNSEVLVSSCYCDHPVWTEEQNLKFRVWHDTGHVLSGLGFDPDGELRLFAKQARAFQGNRDLERAEELVAALFSESVYQLAACIALGGFPDRQFVRGPGPVGRAVLATLLALGDVL